MVVVLKAFGGIRPLQDPTRIEDFAAQTAINCDLRSGSLTALKGTSFVHTPTKPGIKKTIYRFGENVSDESLYWFTWVDDVDVVRSQISGDTSERTLFTGDNTFGHPRWTDATAALTGGGTDYPNASYRLGIPAPTSAPGNGGVSGTGSGTSETRAYVYVYVNMKGDVGKPSPPLIVTMQDGQTINLTGMSAAPSGYGINRKWIYRAVTSVTGTNYQFVAEISDATTSYSDSALTKDLGESIFSSDYDMPPTNLVGLINLPNGIVAGFIKDGIDVCFSEPYRPYAWPVAYRQAVDYPIVGLGAFAESLVVCTKGRPYLMYGSDPNAVAVRKIELDQACVSKRSIVNMGSEVVYASPDGLVSVGAGGTGIVTERIISREYWQSLNPSSIFATQHDGKYIGFYDNGTPGSFVFDPGSPDTPFSLCSVSARAVYTDLVRDTLYLDSGGSIYKLFTGPSLTYTWRSKVFETPRLVSFAFGKVEANAYPVTFRLYADGTLLHTRSVSSAVAFRLPPKRARRWEVELTGTNRVTAAYLAQSPEELAST